MTTSGQLPAPSAMPPAKTFAAWRTPSPWWPAGSCSTAGRPASWSAGRQHHGGSWPATTASLHSSVWPIHDETLARALETAGESAELAPLVGALQRLW